MFYLKFNESYTQMMMPSRSGLKALACFQVDAEFCKQLATKLLSFSGERTKEYDDVDKEVKLILKDIQDTVHTISAELEATL